MDYDGFQHIRFERRAPGILWMTLDRPQVLNATNARMHRELVLLFCDIQPQDGDK